MAALAVSSIPCLSSVFPLASLGCSFPSPSCCLFRCITASLLPSSPYELFRLQSSYSRFILYCAYAALHRRFTLTSVWHILFHHQRTTTPLPIIKMRACNILATLSTVVSCAAAKDAPIVSGNPQGVVFSAFLPKDPFFSGADLVGNVRGNISAVAGPGGKGVKFTVQLQNFPKSGGPFCKHYPSEEVM